MPETTSPVCRFGYINNKVFPQMYKVTKYENALEKVTGL